MSHTPTPWTEAEVIRHPQEVCRLFGEAVAITEQAPIRPYVRFGMSRDANELRSHADWLRFMQSADFAPDHPDFNPDRPRSVAYEVRVLALRIISAGVQV